MRKHREMMMLEDEELEEGDRRQMLIEMEILGDDEEDMLWRDRYKEYKRSRRDIDRMKRMRRGEDERKDQVIVVTSPPLVFTTQEQVLLDKLLVNPVILSTVFSFLPPSDVVRAALVCSTWRDALQGRRFWRWATLKFSESNFTQRFSSARARVVTSWKVTGLPPVQLSLLFSGLKDFKLRRLDLTRTDLSSISGELLSEAMMRLPEVDLTSTSLTDLQLETLLRRITESKPRLRLRRLDFSKLCLSSVPAFLLSRLVLRLEEINLLRTELTELQLTGVFTALLESKTPLSLNKLNLTRNDLSSLPAHLLSRALVRLQEATLFQTTLRTEQVNSLSEALISSQNLSLRKLGLSYNNLFSVSASLLSQAVLRLEELDLRSTNLQSDHVLQVCRAIVETSQLSLRRLNISHNDPVGGEADNYLTQAKQKLQSLGAYLPVV